MFTHPVTSMERRKTKHISIQVSKNWQIKSKALNKMKTGPVIFVGVGAGARILTRVAIETPDLVRGLVLISPTFREAGVWEKLFNMIVQNSTFDAAKSDVDTTLQSERFEGNCTTIENALRNVDSSLIAKFWNTFTNRKKLDDFDIAILREYYILLVVGHNKAFSYSGPNYFSDTGTKKTIESQDAPQRFNSIVAVRWYRRKCPRNSPRM